MVGHFSRIVCTTHTQTQTHTRTFPCCPFSVRSFRRTWRFSSPSTRTYFVFCDFICKNLRSLLSLLLLFPGECVCISKSLLSVKCSYFLRADVLLLWEFCEWIRNIYTCIMENARVMFLSTTVCSLLPKWKLINSISTIEKMQHAHFTLHTDYTGSVDRTTLHTLCTPKKRNAEPHFHRSADIQPSIMFVHR